MNPNTPHAVKLDNHEGRTVLVAGDAPVLMQLVMRPATTAHGRVKAMLVCSVAGDDGDVIPVPMPFASATVGPKGGGGFTPEFRLEMN